ncbi:TonB family protein [Marinoscillum sp.]|uniref:energy transducer TonB n=1 Tax=Marinoscillum sp. TaxID=2024838 RepID=UPI003BA9A6F1
MEPKKNIRYDLERKSPLFYSIGLVVALICVTAAFEWKAAYEPIELPTIKEEFPESYIVPLTAIRDPEPPKPEAIKPIEKPSLQPPIFVDEAPDSKPQPKSEIPDIPFDDVMAPPPPAPDPDPGVFIVVESMPKFPGGDKAFYQFISDHLKYPKEARRHGVEGRVILQFIIDETGKATDIKVLKGIGFGCDQEAIRVLEKLPLYEPGKQRGRAVKVKQTLPIVFKLPY